MTAAPVSPLQAMMIAFLVLAGGWLWTAWDCVHNQHWLAPVRWHQTPHPVGPASCGNWDIQALNASFVPEEPISPFGQVPAENTSSGSAQWSFSLARPWLHPAGVYPARLVDWEAVRDDRGVAAVRWLFASRIRHPSGREVRLVYRTPTRIAPLNRMGRLLQACRMPIPTCEAEAGRINPDSMLGMECLVRVRHRRRILGAASAEVCDVRPRAAMQRNPHPL